jgi:S-adenosylmethionine hydrolase
MVLVGILSDFGLKDSYVAQMKAVILSISPSANIVDISHEIDRHNVQQGMFVLASATPYFPKDTIYLAVVDPGVGGPRRPLLLETRRSRFIGPDNGLLALAAEREDITAAYHLIESQYFAKRVSSTFHGRDVFAHVAGHLANGVSPSLLGQPVSDYTKPQIPTPRLDNDRIIGTAIHIDGFGNVVTNIDRQLLDRKGIGAGSFMRLEINNQVREVSFCSAYADVESGELLAVVGGHGFLEIAVNRGDASRFLEARVESPITIQRVTMK